ncbi:MAG TPA: thioredoxin domain-containing protein [Polyangiaceae bacterium]|jgi:thioredoxin|nr:thioredoxin domain-containing protein [Polyangiaceae bacterium]
MPLPTVNERNFEQEVLLSEEPVLVEFGAEWCGPCKTMAPELLALAGELKGKAKIVTVDIDRSPMIARQLGVQSVPTFVVFHQGRPVGGKVGAVQRRELREMLDPFLPRAEGAIKPEELSQLLPSGRVVPVDTREAPVFARAHLPGAVNVPMSEIETRLAELHMLPGTPVIYCRSGDQTKELAAKLAEQGVPVAFLEGGVLGWEAAGFRLQRPD